MKIFLVGFMGSGKSSLGRKLAHYINYHFLDLDKLIEAKVQMTIAEYFALYGEGSFRQLEKDVLQSSEYGVNTIIATGGGSPCYFDNINWMNQQGKTVYLSMKAASLADRLINSKRERPLIQGFNHEELVNYIKTKLEGREVYYRQAQFMVSGTDMTAEKLAGYLGISPVG
ncbi:MAG: shikimate kinase [Flavobacterium sp.]|nr:shikimate kinase [Pedobacter sp.]